MSSKASFKSQMFVYAAENYRSFKMPEKIKVFIPEVFFVDNNNTAKDINLHKGNMSIFANATIPVISDCSTSYNYMILPMISSAQLFTRDDDGRYIIKKGTRFVSQFINENPEYGLITARCENI